MENRFCLTTETLLLVIVSSFTLDIIIISFQLIEMLLKIINDKDYLPEHSLMLYQLCIVLLYVMCVYHISFLYRMSFFPLERLPFSMYNNDDKLYYTIIVIRHIV